MGLIQDANDVGYEPITLEAHDLVFGARQGSYGHPIDDFTCTARCWTAYLQHRGIIPPDAWIDAEDVGPMMIYVKLSRQANAPKRDNMTDTAGYAETTERVIYERARREHRDAALVELLLEQSMAAELGLKNQDLEFYPEEPTNSIEPCIRPGAAASTLEPCQGHMVQLFGTPLVGRE